MKAPFSFLLVLMLLISSCKNDKKELKEGVLKVSVELYNGNERVSINDTVRLTDEYDFFISLFRLYLAEVEVRDNTGSYEVSSIELVDPASDLDNSFSAEILVGDYNSLELGFGVDPLQNDMDPGSFPNEHPLSSYQSMYWSMLKYRFAKFEGKAKSRLTGQDNIFVAYHPGLDSLYQKKNFDLSFSVSETATTQLVLSIDLNEILDGPAGKIDLATEPQTHSTPADFDIARKFMVNLAASAKLISISP